MYIYMCIYIYTFIYVYPPIHTLLFDCEGGGGDQVGGERGTARAVQGAAGRLPGSVDYVTICICSIIYSSSGSSRCGTASR